MASFVVTYSRLNALRKRNYKVSNIRKCRVCNSNQGNIPIFNKRQGSNLAEAIHKFSGVVITHRDKFSKYICKRCLDLLHKCFLFREMCVKTNKLLRKTTNVRENAVEIDAFNPVYNWRCPCCSTVFPDLKSYYKHLPQCEKQQAKEISTQVKVDVKIEPTSYQQDRADNDPDYSEDFHNDSKMTENISDDNYSIPSPKFPDEEDTSVTCPFCQRCFFDNDSYSRHLWYSKRCKEYANQPKQEPKSNVRPKALCEICGKTVSKPTIVAHKRLHKNVFPFACDSCPYRGRTKNLLIVHLRSHMSVKPYKCTLCPKTLTSTSNLAKHMDSTHCDDRSFKCVCPECGKQFLYEQSMKKHIANVHRNQNRVECNICYKSFRPKHINRHRRSVHKIDTPQNVRPSNRLPSYIKCMMEEDYVPEEPEELEPENMSLEIDFQQI